jgi:putative hydrolase of the HAD superfamily
MNRIVYRGANLLTPLPGIRAVAFDAVGTLIYPQPPAPAVYFEIGRRFGSRLSLQVIGDRFRAVFQQEEEMDRRHQYRTSEAREVERWQSIVSNVLTDVTDQEACFCQLFEHFAQPNSWSCNPDSRTVVDSLRGQRLPLAVASNYDRRLHSVMEGISSLRGLNLVISSEVGWRKPSLPFFAVLCKTLGMQPSQVLYVGDDPANDYAGAIAAGLQAALFDPKNRSHVPAKIESLKEVLELVGSEP